MLNNASSLLRIIWFEVVIGTITVKNHRSSGDFQRLRSNRVYHAENYQISHSLLCVLWERYKGEQKPFCALKRRARDFSEPKRGALYLTTQTCSDLLRLVAASFKRRNEPGASTVQTSIRWDKAVSPATAPSGMCRTTLVQETIRKITPLFYNNTQRSWGRPAIVYCCHSDANNQQKSLKLDLRSDISAKYSLKMQRSEPLHTWHASASLRSTKPNVHGHKKGHLHFCPQ